MTLREKVPPEERRIFRSKFYIQSQQRSSPHCKNNPNFGSFELRINYIIQRNYETFIGIFVDNE